jgi:hypothetical protein
MKRIIIIIIIIIIIKCVDGKPFKCLSYSKKFVTVIFIDIMHILQFNATAANSDVQVF